MKKDKILIFLFVGLALAVVALYFYTKSKKSKKPAEKFPLENGSTGNAVKMLQVSCNVPITGVFDSATLDGIKAVYGIDKVQATDFLNFVFSGAGSNFSFPMEIGSTGPYVECVQIMVGAEPSGKFDNSTTAALKKATGLIKLSLSDYRNLISNTLGV